ncbi:hypothetical protein TrLO_g4526 [Triparma laevis f. longispina]|uniref:Uncharacterized protein n=1 Tax=Triparma laevis f. longispina TaxID=1714387 RepID=A0A9W6Z573_9STRA|nr:hypothetical protein TrLO_g4526 [Triparma laevis f. longispina]
MSDSAPILSFTLPQVQAWLLRTVDGVLLDGKIIGDEDDERTRMMMSAFLDFALDNLLTEEATLVKGSPATSANDPPIKPVPI